MIIAITPTLHYNSETGNAWFTAHTYSRVLSAKDTSGYIHATVNKAKYGLHRLAWEAIFGKIPKGYEIDHIDRNRGNNKLSNLRCVSREQNQVNKKLTPGKTGYIGVKWSKRHSRFTSVVSHMGKDYYVYQGRDARVAYNRYREKKIELCGKDFVAHLPPPIPIIIQVA